ncbi:MAG: hypothetical protein NZM43_11595 [Saprospiraceae bacterium]|nr:hypothetical protein [Saprospiraceae bacterium]MDW8484952.1 hypothetical protein [Saprospiraceae bacterium]
MRASLLADFAFFSSLGRWKSWYWAEMPVSVERVHYIAYDTATGTLYCTCSFRPRPCLHAQALALLLERHENAFFEEHACPPEWLSSISVAAGARKPKKASSVASVSDAHERTARIERGLKELEVWLEDVLQRGIAASISEDAQFYLAITTRLADASMRNLSRRIRIAGEALARQAEYYESFVVTLAEAALAVQAWKQRHRLTQSQRYDLETFLGFSPSKEFVYLQGEHLQDIWAVLGLVEETLEASLRERRTWLLGAKSGRFALFQEYAFGAENFTLPFPLGKLVQGSVVYYPSAWPLRALSREPLKTIPGRRVKKLPGFRTFSEMALTFARALSNHPYLMAFPAVLLEVTPKHIAQGFVLIDRENFCLSLNCSSQVGWSLIAASEGRPLTVFGEWNGVSFRPLSAISHERFIHLQSICEWSSLAAAPLD